MPTIDTTGIATGFQPVGEPGWYPAVLTGVKTREAEGDKEAMTTLELTIEGPEEDGHKVWRNYPLSLKALPYIKGDAVKLGVEPSILEGPWDPQEILSGQLGVKVKILVRHRMWQGDTQDDVRRIEPRDYEPSNVSAGATAQKGGW